MSGNKKIEYPAVVKLDSWEQFIQAMRPHDGMPLDPIYRGQARSEWRLVAPIVRGADASIRQFRRLGVDVRVDGILRNREPIGYFRRLATGLPNVDMSGLEDIDVAALGRHNGLLTNLLDWTVSPYVAAFFAANDAMNIANSGHLHSGRLRSEPTVLPDDPIVVWRMAVTPDLLVDGEFTIVNSLSPVNFWQKAQQGIFSRLVHDDFLSMEDYF